MIEMFGLGLLGSLHCVAMCGPFALGFSCRGRRATLAYQMGRLLGYSSIGAVLGTLATPLQGWLGSRILLGAAGLAMLALGLGWSPPRLPLGGLLVRFSRWLRQPGLRGSLLAGLITALFPCGLMSAAWVRAAAMGYPLLAAAAMACFWAGTVPALLLVGRLGERLRGASSQWVSLLAPSLLTLLGLSLLVQAWMGCGCSSNGCN